MLQAVVFCFIETSKWYAQVEHCSTCAHHLLSPIKQSTTTDISQQALTPSARRGGSSWCVVYKVHAACAGLLHSMMMMLRLVSPYLQTDEVLYLSASRFKAGWHLPAPTLWCLATSDSCAWPAASCCRSAWWLPHLLGAGTYAGLNCPPCMLCSSPLLVPTSNSIDGTPERDVSQWPKLALASPMIRSGCSTATSCT